MAAVVVREGNVVRWIGVLRNREARVRFGRGASVDVKIKRSDVARLHAHLELRGRRLFIIDDASTNGTFVNDSRALGPTPVSAADEIRIGDVRFSVECTLDESEINGPDAKEEEFLDAILKNPKDDEQRLVYADWLEEHGHARRAELLRLQCEQVGRDDLGLDDIEQKRLELRLEALSRQDEAWWRALIARSPIEKCDSSSAAVTFKFKCPKRWSELEPTPKATIRFCNECKREVFFCSNLEAVRYRASRNECVAFDSSLRRRRSLTVYDGLDRFPVDGNSPAPGNADDMTFEMGEVG